jgi:hypothetical protein
MYLPVVIGKVLYGWEKMNKLNILQCYFKCVSQRFASRNQDLTLTKRYTLRLLLTA